MTETAIVVGVGPGLGLALVETFAGAGMNVAMAARSAEALEVMKPADAGERVRVYPTDTADAQSVAGLFDAVDQDWGTADLVIFNAGAFTPDSFLDITPEAFEQCWRVGTLGGFLVGQQAARRMVDRGHGTIIFTGATAALRGSANFLNLAAPKFGLRAVAQSMARELGPKGVHVAHVIVDGIIDGPRSRGFVGDPGPDQLLNPADIASTYLHLHCQPRSAWTQELDLRPWVEKF